MNKMDSKGTWKSRLSVNTLILSLTLYLPLTNG